MPKVSPGNKLYLYQLFSREIGVGKQEMLPRFAEALEADDVWLDDFDVAELRELLELCPEFVKVTVFKKGRVYATVLRNEEWDKWLAPGKAAEEKPAAAKGGKKGGKPWKAKSAAAKSKQLKPVKPRHKARPVVEEPEQVEVGAVAAESDDRASRRAGSFDSGSFGPSAQDDTGLEAEGPVARDDRGLEAEGNARLGAEGSAVQDNVGLGSADEELGDDTRASRRAGSFDSGSFGPSAQDDTGLEAEGQVARDDRGLGAGSPVARDAEGLAVAGGTARDDTGLGAEDNSEAEPESGPRQLASLAEQIAAETARLEAEQAAFEAEIDAVVAEATKAQAQSASPAPSTPLVPKVTRRVGRFASALAQNVVPHTPRVESVTDTSVPAEVAAQPEAEGTATPQKPVVPSDQDGSTPESPVQNGAAAPPRSTTKNPLPELTVEDFGPAQAELEAPIAPPVAPKPRPSTPAGADFPEHFASDVHCKDELLRQLYQVLPLDVDLMAVLDEDWRVARSTGTLSGSRAKVTFPLRYCHENDGSPVEITLRRASKPIAGKRWNLAYIDGDDGSGRALTASGIEGLPASDEGAWHDLSSHAATDASPVRALAQFAVLGSWEQVLGTLATAATPERWNYPGEGVGKQSRYGILREYLSCTFFRAQAQGLIAEDRDRSFAAFNTGLITPFGQDLFACFTPHRGDIPWKLAGFATPGSGELGSELIARLERLPEPPSYLARLTDIVPSRERMVILDTEALLTRELGHLPKAFLEEQLEGNTIASEVLQQEFNEARGGLDRESLALISRTIKSDPGLYRRMCRALDDALDLAMRKARASYRVAVPVYDPSVNATKLLLPLSLVNDAHVDCAIVLAPQPSGNIRAATLLPLARAYACARVVSAEQPKWLSPETVLQ